MNDLDAKLREIIVHHKGLNIPLNDEAIAQIKQAFINNGYVRFSALEYKDTLRSGQEWYDRFEKELGLVDDKAMDTSTHYGFAEILEAARKAAGLG